MPLLFILAAVVATVHLTGNPLFGLLGIGALVGAMLLATWRAIRRGLPVKVEFRPTNQELLPATAQAIAAFERLGFARLAPGYLAEIPLVPLVVPLAHPTSGLLAAVYELRTPRGRTCYDIVSTTAGNALLTSSSAADAGILPRPADRFLQIASDAPPADLLAMHFAGLDQLRAAGRDVVGPHPATAEEVCAAIGAGIHEQRERAERAPLRTTVTALWRSLAKRSPHQAPLAQQLA